MHLYHLLSAVELLGGLQHMHDRNILHRDVKPANIFLTEAGTVRTLFIPRQNALRNDHARMNCDGI